MLYVRLNFKGFFTLQQTVQLLSQYGTRTIELCIIIITSIFLLVFG